MPEDIVEEATETSVSSGQVVYKYDFLKKEHVVQNGRFVPCTRREAIQQWVELCVRTEIDAYEIYSGTEFGANVKSDLLGRKKSDTAYEIAISGLSNRVISHSDINSISDYEVLTEGTRTIIRLSLETEIGSINQEVIYRG